MLLFIAIHLSILSSLALAFVTVPVFNPCPTITRTTTSCATPVSADPEIVGPYTSCLRPIVTTTVTDIVTSIKFRACPELAERQVIGTPVPKPTLTCIPPIEPYVVVVPCLQCQKIPVTQTVTTTLTKLVLETCGPLHTVPFGSFPVIVAATATPAP